MGMSDKEFYAVIGIMLVIGLLTLLIFTLPRPPFREGVFSYSLRCSIS